MNLKSEKTFIKIKAKIKNLYTENLLEVINTYKSNRNILKKFKIVFDDNIKFIEGYNNFNFYWLDRYLKFLEIYDHTYFKSDLIETDDVLIDFWSNGDYQKEFFKFIKNNDLIEASKKLLKMEEDQIINLFKIQYLSQPFPKNFKPVLELGHKRRKISKVFEIDGLYYHDLLDDLNKQKARILKALHIIKNYHPIGYSRFKHFTTNILPTNDESIVSYSMQQLPGYSIINLYHRDNIDLLDDLLHENGHHHMNYYLNQSHLINEDDEKIFYSPWRKALRPIRGIYHAVFTFYFALELFAILSQHPDKFSKKDYQKILFRFCEEYLMLEYCILDLEFAYKDGKITRQGYKLISEIFELILEQKKSFNRTVKILPLSSLNKINKLRDTLKQQRKITKTLQV